MTTPTKSAQGHIPELQLVRALAILGVITVHASAQATITMKESAYFYFYNFINTFMRFGTPTFILLSSFVLFYSYYRRPLDAKLLSGFYKKRLLYIIVPYVVFSAIYFAYVKQVNALPLWTIDALAEFARKLLKGEVYAHLYFVFISIQFYLLFPLLLWACKRWKSFAYALVPLGFVLQWIFVLLNFYDWQLDNKGSWSPAYFSLFFLGAALGIFYPKLKNWLAMTRDNATRMRVFLWSLLWAAWLGVALTHVAIYYQLRLHETAYHGLLYELLWNAHAVLTALIVLHAAYFIQRHLPAIVSRTLSRLGQFSFGIYLVHLLYQAFYEKLLPPPSAAWALHLHYFCGWVVMLAASWLTVALASRFVPFSWVLFGNIRRRGDRSPDVTEADGSKVSAGKKTVTV
ncbi:acyltransferase [Paenibacillus sp. LHD-117]|uniref:acyltransferase n=1 Tax=Paenibacillus sp. LHD-117 TaxID=3071412 RepID=UPI0027E14A00|nr:acyltransferase [Paenibacillus sp. LHD-117]MDQ6421009.1 acyltransferase [Paenibacillus sp. LHD-117]